MNKTIVLTGGGTAGHVMPNLALLERLRADQWTIHYVGTADGMEHTILANETDIPYHCIKAGKLRRYIDLRNLTDPMNVIKGYFQSRKVLKSIKPAVVFSKGGFVSVPVAAAAAHLGIPVVIHESDLTPGLANKLSLRFTNKVCVTFEQTLSYLPSSKAVLTGTPIRSRLLNGNAQEARRAYGLTKPVIFVMGGSQGARVINDTIRELLPKLLDKFDVVHLCGKNNLIDSKQKGYVQIEFADRELPDLLAVADIVISRAGANSIFEFLALKKPMLLIPLSRASSRGDQCDNAECFARLGYAKVLEQEQTTPASLYPAILDLYQQRDVLTQNMTRAANTTSGTDNVIQVIYSQAKK